MLPWDQRIFQAELIGLSWKDLRLLMVGIRHREYLITRFTGLNWDYSRRVWIDAWKGYFLGSQLTNIFFWFLEITSRTNRRSPMNMFLKRIPIPANVALWLESWTSDQTISAVIDINRPLALITIWKTSFRSGIAEKRTNAPPRLRSWISPSTRSSPAFFTTGNLTLVRG